MILRDTVQRVRAGLAPDGYGNTVPDWNVATATTYPAEVQPATTSEDVVDQDRTTTRWRIFLPATADVQASDRITWDGATFEVEGDIERWKRRGVLHHLEAVLIRTTQG